MDGDSDLSPKAPLLGGSVNGGSGEKDYYERQLATLKSFEDVDSLVSSDCIDEEDMEERAQQERAMKISNYANIVLLLLKVVYVTMTLLPLDEEFHWHRLMLSSISYDNTTQQLSGSVLLPCFKSSTHSLSSDNLQIYATVRSGSIAIAASTLDSLLDLMAGGILWFTHLYMKRVNIYKFPIGKLRVQPVGIIVFAAVMATLGFQVLLQAVEQLIQDKPSESLSSEQFVWLCAIMTFATVVKLALWLYCKNSRNDIVRAYAKDHYFDVVTNVVGLVAAILGDKIFWWIDPVGAIALAIYTILNWSGTVWENAVSLVGKSAPPEVLQMLTYLVIRHPEVKRVDTVRAYTFGVLYFVEVDIELPEELPLKEAHAIGETLQIKIEKLPEVERAFVHLDFECEHKPEHSILSRLPNTQP
ncbi:metal tolerance protein 4 isoform X2 [Cucumis melo var. makuwa]|uniref:Metal tolerance protein 4 isoform X2 n=1 Tax=Cucumis melo var. makuwa TaxID=1194695 RepID=A0A5D3CS67_CUCMM|nr:metal tolerance protein 4 isoform X2 [Cucumis melo var. makuwa]